MVNDKRRHPRFKLNGLIAKIIIGVIIAVFALFGVMRSTTLPGVAEVNGQEISEAQLHRKRSPTETERRRNQT